MRRFRLAIVAALAVAGVDAAARLAGFAIPSAVAGVLAAAACAAACVVRSRRRAGRSHRAWLLMAAAAGVWAAAGVVAQFSPALGDIARLGFAPLAAVAFASIPVAPKTLTGRSKLAVDAVIITASVLTLSWNVALGPVFYGRRGEAVALAFPIADIVLLALVLFVGARVAGRQRSTMALVAVGIVAMATANTVHALGRPDSGVAGIGWVTGLVVIAAAALRPDSPDDRGTGRFGALVPYLPIAVGVPIQVVKFMQTGRFDPVEFGAGMVLFVAVAFRQLVYAVENRALVHDLEAKVKERTAELERAADQLRDAAVRQEDFVSHASHELFTPLTTLVASIDLLSDGGLDGHRESSLLAMAGRAARRMSQLVDDLMLATHLNGFVACERSPFDVPARIRLALVGLDAPDKTVQARVVEGLTAVGDAERFQTALEHVLENAHKFAPCGSTITIDAIVDGDDAAVVVTDEGSGVSPEFREIAFERFSQLDGSDTRRHDGLGLGLFLARQVMHAMGGRIGFDDTETGCRVRLTLPRAAAPSEERVRPARSGVRRTYG